MIVAVVLIGFCGALAWVSNFNPVMVNIFAMVVSGLVSFYFGVNYALAKLKGAGA